MKKTYGFLYCCIMLLLAACSKDKPVVPVLPTDGISIQGLDLSDTLERRAEILRDQVTIIGLKALSKSVVASGVDVRFGVDTSKMEIYRAKYGNATVLPSTAFYFYKPDCRIPAGSTVSDSVKLNLVKQTSLNPYTTYVLPVTIRSVNGQEEGIAPGQVLYLVIKTGKSSFNLTVVSFSSQTLPGNGVSNVVDGLPDSYWSSSLGLNMPQYFTVDFGTATPFSAISYQYPIRNVLIGAYPTQIKIELSTDGTTWTDKGTFNQANPPAQAVQIIPVSNTTARYMRFTVLAAQPVFGSRQGVFISDLTLVP